MRQEEARITRAAERRERLAAERRESRRQPTCHVCLITFASHLDLALHDRAGVHPGYCALCGWMDYDAGTPQAAGEELARHRDAYHISCTHDDCTSEGTLWFRNGDCLDLHNNQAHGIGAEPEVAIPVEMIETLRESIRRPRADYTF
jgi:hypothetical protein